MISSSIIQRSPDREAALEARPRSIGPAFGRDGFDETSSPHIVRPF
jgi:hypothetical protein